MIQTLGIQLYTIRDALGDEAQVKESLAKLKAYGYTDLHTAGFPPMPVERFAELIREAGLRVCGTHYSFEKMLNDPEGAMEEHRILGTRYMGIGGMPGPARTSKEELLKFIDQANKVGENVSRYGFKFTYHNHSFEFCKIDGKRIIDYLVEGLDPKTCSFVLDTYWVQHGGGDPIWWIKKLAGRIDILHLKDMKMTPEGQKYAEICEGNMNFDGIMEAAESIGVKYYVVEQDTCPGDPFDSAKLSSENIHKRYM